MKENLASEADSKFYKHSFKYASEVDGNVLLKA